MLYKRLDQAKSDIIKRTLAPFGDKIERVGLFGSYATGKARANSRL